MPSTNFDVDLIIRTERRNQLPEKTFHGLSTLDIDRFSGQPSRPSSDQSLMSPTSLSYKASISRLKLLRHRKPNKNKCLHSIRRVTIDSSVVLPRVHPLSSTADFNSYHKGSGSKVTNMVSKLQGIHVSDSLHKHPSNTTNAEPQQNYSQRLACDSALDMPRKSVSRFQLDKSFSSSKFFFGPQTKITLNDLLEYDIPCHVKSRTSDEVLQIRSSGIKALPAITDQPDHDSRTRLSSTIDRREIPSGHKSLTLSLLSFLRESFRGDNRLVSLTTSGPEHEQEGHGPRWSQGMAQTFHGGQRWQQEVQRDLPPAHIYQTRGTSQKRNAQVSDLTRINPVSRTNTEPLDTEEYPSPVTRVVISSCPRPPCV